jgi:hypothetical protein
LVELPASDARTPAAAPTPPPPQADANLLPRKLLFGNPDHLSPSLSPNGNQIAFIAPDNGVLNVWVGPADDVKAAKVVTHEKVRPIRSFMWAYTNEHILYENDKGGDENFHIFAVDLKSSKEDDLTPFDGVRADLGDTYDDKPTVVFAQMNKRDKRFMDPVLIDIKTKVITPLAENTEGFVSYVVDRAAKLRMAAKMMPDGGLELFTPDKPGTWATYAKIAPEDNQTTQPLEFERNNRTLYFRDSRGRDTSALVTVEMPAGKPKVIFEDAKSDVERLLLHPKQGKVQAVATNRERRVGRFSTRRPATSGVAKVTEGDMRVVNRSLDDKRWVAVPTRRRPTGFTSDRGKKRRRLSPIAPPRVKLPRCTPSSSRRDGLGRELPSLPREADAAGSGKTGAPP